MMTLVALRATGRSEQRPYRLGDAATIAGHLIRKRL